MTVGLLPQIIYSPNNDVGTSSPGSRLTFYEAGSTTNLKAIFSDFAGTPLTNPTFADGAGRFSQIVLDDGAGLYNVQFSLSDGAQSPTYTQKWFIDLVGFAGSDPLLLGDGTAAAPPYSFASETNTGFLLSASGVLAASVLGNEVVQWTAQGLNIATSGEAATPSLIMEGDTDTGWRQDGVNNWTFSALGQDQMSISAGLLELPGTTIGGNVLKLGAKTGQDSVFRSQGDDIAQPFTSLGEANSYYEYRPLSTTLGGGLLTGFSSGNAKPLVIRGFIGSAAPSTSTAAIELRAGKSDGGTGATDLASTELAFAVTGASGTTQLLNVFGNGDMTVAGDFTADGGGVTISGSTNPFLKLDDGTLTSFFEMVGGVLRVSRGNVLFTGNASGDFDITTGGFSVANGVVTLNLPTSPGATGTLYSNSGVVTVSP